MPVFNPYDEYKVVKSRIECKISGLTANAIKASFFYKLFIFRQKISLKCSFIL